MLLLAAGTTDKVRLVTSAAATIDVHCSYVDASNADPPVIKGSTMGRQVTAITTATTTDIVATPGAGVVRNVKAIFVRNKHASLSCDVTVLIDVSATQYELHKASLAAGETLEYVEGVGFFTLRPSAKFERLLVMSADYTNATTSFTDITGLTIAVESGKTYAVEANLIHQNDATTTGSQFGINGPSMTYNIVATIDTVTPSVTASAHSAGATTALDTAITAQTTGATSNRLAIIAGTIIPSAAGTFAMRGKSEVAVAAGLTVRRGSWLWIRESD